MKEFTRLELGEFIKSRRKSLGVTQEYIAKKANISRQCVIRIEKGYKAYPFIINAILGVLHFKEKYKIID